MSNPPLGQPSSGEPRTLDYFSEERSHYAAVAYSRTEMRTEVRHHMAPLAETADRLARELEGEHKRLAEDLRDSLHRLIQRAGDTTLD